MPFIGPDTVGGDRSGEINGGRRWSFIKASVMSRETSRWERSGVGPGEEREQRRRRSGGRRCTAR
jgi:hypothetical protein